LPTGRVLLTVGDVAGRGERAAITMGRLRTVLRASARQERSPATLMSTINRFLVDDEHEMATCVCAVLDPAERRLRVASAGHLPILRVGSDGHGELIGGATGLPLGVRAFASYREDVFEVEPGDTLVLFTDGLVERRDASIDARLERLLAVTTEAIATGGDRWCDLVVNAMIEEQRGDDVAVLGVRLASGPQTFFSRTRAELGELHDLRDQLRAWLAANRVDHDTVDALCLAVGEATANVAMHAYGPTGGELRVQGTIDDGVVRIRIEDDGHWRPSPDDLGRGMRIIEQLADTVHVDRRDDGTTIDLARRISTG
jgi:anti-sigma regulatory factor (Ser/Thr protein kinase)